MGSSTDNSGAARVPGAGPDGRPGPLDRPHIPGPGRGQGPRGHLPLLGGEDPHNRRWGGHLRLPEDVGQHPGGGTEVLVFLVGMVLQFSTRRYRALAYWFLAFAIAIFGTGVSDFLHLDVHIPYAGTTLLWARGTGRHLLALAAQRGHAVNPQHHDPASRSLLLGNRVRNLCPRHRSRGLHGDIAQPGLPGLRASSSASSSCSRPWRGGVSA